MKTTYCSHCGLGWAIPTGTITPRGATCRELIAAEPGFDSFDPDHIDDRARWSDLCGAAVIARTGAVLS